MFYNLVFRNSRRSRKENGLFFSSLVISIVAFYMILSISSQDVMIFLKKMESAAIEKLLGIIPTFYFMTLVILFFLIYFACKYQFERRRHEFGVYLMLGMQRKKLFRMLMEEDLLNSLLALLVGLPTAVALSEVVSLTTSKLVGMGIIGHHFSLSWFAIQWTLVGFLGIKLLAILILSGKICHQEIGKLLYPPTNRFKKQLSAFFYGIATVFGIALLSIAYYEAIKGNAWLKDGEMFVILAIGLIGTLLLFYGMRALISLIVKKDKKDKQLHVFTFRQIQENVIHQSSSMAISSLLILAALCCFGAGMGIAITGNLSARHVVDYTFTDYSTEDHTQTLTKIKTTLQKNGLDNHFSDIFEIKIGHNQLQQDYSEVFETDSIKEALKKQPSSREKYLILSHLKDNKNPTLICLSDYNHLLKSAGKPVLNLKENEAAVYMSANFNSPQTESLMNDILAKHYETKLAGKSTYLTGKVQTMNLFATNSYSMSFALILPDDAFFYNTQNQYGAYVNAVFSDKAIKGKSLMNAHSNMNEKLNQLGISYKSYLETMGRQLFFNVSSSYITLYLAIVFLVVANTIMGVQFLMNQQKTGNRYQTLIRLGATYETLCKSAHKQISWFMGLPVLVASINSILAVRSLFQGILSREAYKTMNSTLIISAAMILLLCVVEYTYMKVIKRSSNKYLLTLMKPQREE